MALILGTVAPVSPACAALPLSPASLSNLAAALELYSVDYDDAFEEAGARIRVAGHATKLDIGGLACWKRMRCDTPWVRKLQALPQSTVVAATRSAFGPGLTPEARVKALQERLSHGMHGKFALGSAILTAWNPKDFAVADRWARDALRAAGCTCDVTDYPVYLEHVIEIRTQLRTAYPADTIDARDVDKALFSARFVARHIVALLLLRS